MEELKKLSDKWFLTEPLLFTVFCSHNLVEDETMKIPVRCGKGNITYNPTLMSKMPPNMIEKYIKLECLRILLKHPYSRQPLGANPNILVSASDITVNEYCNDLPKNTLSIKDFKPNFPPKLTFEDYYYLMVPEMEKLISKILQMLGVQGDGNDDCDGQGGQGGQDGQDGQDNTQGNQGKNNKNKKNSSGSGQEENNEKGGGESTLDKMTKEELKELLQKLLEGAVEWEENEEMDEKIGKIVQQAIDTDKWGSVSGDMKQQIIAAQVPVLNIKKHLQHFKTSIISCGTTLTRMRPNRRYGFKQMGVKHPYTTRLLIGVDTSGSVSDRELQKFFGTINTFFKQGIETIDVMEFDADITGEKPMNMKKAMKEIKITGRGGTDFQPVIDYGVKNNYDGLIMFTDGYASQPTVPKGFNILWVLTNKNDYERFKYSDKKIYIKA